MITLPPLLSLAKCAPAIYLDSDPYRRSRESPPSVAGDRRRTGSRHGRQAGSLRMTGAGSEGLPSAPIAPSPPPPLRPPPWSMPTGKRMTRSIGWKPRQPTGRKPRPKAIAVRKTDRRQTFIPFREIPRSDVLADDCAAIVSQLEPWADYEQTADEISAGLAIPVDRVRAALTWLWRRGVVRRSRTGEWFGVEPAARRWQGAEDGRP